jgi:hypothetical protein
MRRISVLRPFSPSASSFHNYNDFIIVLCQLQEFEFLTLARSRPASLKISSTIEPHIERTRKSEILRKVLLEKFPIASSKSSVRSLC